MPMGNKLCGLGSLRRRSSKRKRKTSNNHSSPTESTQNVHSDPQPSESVRVCNNISCGLGKLFSSSGRERKEPNIPSSPTEITQNGVHSDSQPSESASTQSEVQPNPQLSESASTPSEVQPDPEPSESEDYCVCYRHTGEDLPALIWWNSYNYHRRDEKRTAQQILEDVGEQAITHLIIKYKLPSSLKDIAPNLTHLCIHKLEDHSQLDSLRELMELKVLHLEHTDFSSGLPSVIVELKSLTELHLLNGKLTNLPEDLRELKELKMLHLHGNDFSNGLPSVIGELKSLVELHLPWSKLTDLPDNMSKLRQLKILSLDLADFSKGLPKVITKLTSLTNLSVVLCHLASLPPSMSELNQLNVLDLGGNDFSKGLPEVITELTSLTKLSLAGCDLTSLPPRFGMLQQLEVLDLESPRYSLTVSAPYTDLPKGMSELKRLKILKLRGHDFSGGLPEVILRLTSLTELSLRDCHLTSLPSRIGQLQQLEKLVLMRNNFSNGLSNEIGDLNSLTQLYLADCSLTDLPQRFGKLQQLEELYLNGNNFLNGLPDVITELHSLTRLQLSSCSLTDLPPRLVNLRQLRELYLRHNKLKEIPSVTYKLEELKYLDLDHNDELVEMDKRILQLKDLQEIGLRGTSLRPILGDVARGGLKMVKKYFVDLAKKSVISTIPVVIIGEAKAGKTSIRKCLISRERECIDRSTTGENATEVFEVEKLVLETSEVNLIDFGGQDIYHVTYQLALKKTCVPLLVVDMAEYEQRIDATGSAEKATKRLCMEWLCHLYVAHPTLGSPMLALTHIDQCHKTYEELKGTLLQNAKSIQQKWLKSEQNISGTDQKMDGNSECITCIKKLKFCTEDIFQFTNDTETSDIAKLTERIESRCVDKIPQNWNDVSDFLKSTEKPYINISDIDGTKFPDYEDILQYLHTTGAILWFKRKKELAKYVFHHTADVTNMVALLFRLDKMETKEKWLDCFSEFEHDGQHIGTAMYNKFLDNFLGETPGMIDKALLHNLVATQSAFKIAAESAKELVVELAIELLKSFCIIHGPIMLDDDLASRTVYFVPSIIKTLMDKSWETSGQLQLRLDFIFNGLPLPKHVYQLMTVRVLNLKMEDESVKAASNGGMLRHDESCATYLVHDYDERKVIVQVSTNLGSLNDSWRRLKSTTEDLKTMLKEEWPACRVELKTYCAHCLFLRDPAPGSTPNPTWYTTNKTYSGLKPRKCLKSDASNHTVPTPLLLPCSKLDSTEIAELEEKYLTKWQPEAFDADANRK